MKIPSLIIDNWCAIGHAEVALDDRGLMLIQGLNHDDTSQISNGAGKSTIPEALSWCFFGETAKEEDGDKVVNRKAGKDASVMAEVFDEDTGDTWRVSRYRKHSKYKNQLRLELQDSATAYWQDKTQGTDKLTQVMVDKVIGCNYEVFKAAIYAGQEAMPDLPAMTDKQLKVLIEESAGVAQLQAAADVANRILKERKAVVMETSNKIMNIQAGIASLQASIDQAIIDRDEYEATRDTQVKGFEAHLATATAAFDPALGPRLETAQVKLKADIVDIQKGIAGSDAERVEERKLSECAQQLASAETQLESQLTREAREAQEARHAMDHVSDKVGESCGSCGHVIEAGDLAGATDAAKAKAVAAVRAAQATKEALGKARTASSVASSALTAHRASMTNVSAMTAALSERNEKVQKLSAAWQAWHTQQKSLVGMQTTIDERKAQPNPYLKTIDDSTKRMEAAKLDIDVLDAQRLEQQVEQEVAEHVAKVYGPAGVRAHILDTVTPLLNSRTSHYLSTLTDGNVTAVWSTISKTAKGELREKFVIDVISATGGETYKSLSGGEKRKVRLACAMALQDLVASRAAKPIRLWVADEIDHALDGAGLERLMTILDDKSRDKGTVLVISHTDLTDSIRESMTIEKRGGQATIRT